MMTGNGNKIDCKIVDVSLPVPPQTTPAGFDLLARFTLLVRPLRIVGCSLVRAPNGRLLIWTPSPDVKVARAWRDDLVDVVLQEIEAAKERLGMHEY
ncbi:hypothetical protein [Roseovarius sp. D0-M9]|uniref:hypothetical protein n=1 Tax=Roseovarius sp. D0-M9 TaxID=3127117 RepID=UPI00300FED9B